MGFFSWNCNECDHPMLSQYAINDVNAWMHEVVVISPDSKETLQGFYDGYGRVLATVGKEGDIAQHQKGQSIHEPGSDPEPSCYHLACWLKAGSPTKYKPSEYSADQGYFFGPGVHDMPRPQYIPPPQTLEEIPTRECRDHIGETYTPEEDCPMCLEERKGD